MNPMAWFFAVYAVIVGIEVALWQVGSVAGWAAQQTQALVLYYILAVWILRDSAKRLPGFPSDWGLFLPVIIVPAYVLTSRGFRGIGLLGLLAGGVISVHLLGWLVSWVIFFTSGG